MTKKKDPQVLNSPPQVGVQNTPLHLYSIYRHFDEGRWFLPTHQRKLVWDKKKIAKWFKDIIQMHKDGGGILPGCVMIYSLPGSNKIYLNDGAQRVYWTILQFIDYCKANELDWKEILNSVQITVQTVAYKSINEAIKGFIQINFGTTATPYELARTMMCEKLENFSTSWEPRLFKIQCIVKDALLSMQAETEDREDADKRDLAHKRIRDELHLFWKFISKDKTQWSPQVALSNLRPDQWDKHTKLERQLTDLLNKIGPVEADIRIAAFSKFIQEQAALYKQVWAELKPEADRPANVHMRWWLAVAIYLTNNDLDHHLRIFTESLIKHSEGRTSVFYVNEKGKQCNCNTAMSKLQQLGMISKILGIEFSPKPKRKKSKRLLRKGFVHSHIQAHAHHGDGKTIAENAIENRHRGGRDMTEDEEKRCKAVNDLGVTLNGKPVFKPC